MDPTLLLPAWQHPPTVVTHSACHFAGAWAPVTLPVTGLPSSVQHRWVLDAATAPPDLYFNAAVRLNRRAAWRFLDRFPPQQTYSPAMQNAITETVQALVAELQTVQMSGPLAIVGHEQGQEISTWFRRRHLVDSWWRAAWRGPLWHGPVILVADPEAVSLTIDSQTATRPLVPVRRIHPDSVDRPGIASELMDLRLDRLRPPPQDWPQWLRRGLRSYAATTADGTIIAGRRLRLRLQEAGEDGIATLLADQASDEELSLAVVAYLLHSRRQHHLASFLDLLRHGTAAVDALQIAYGIAIDDLIP